MHQLCIVVSVALHGEFERFGGFCVDYFLALINRAGGVYGSVLENLDQGRKYRPNAVRSVHTTEVKILPCRPA